MLGTVTLFVPAISTKKAQKALSMGVDTIYFDLEDSVSLSQKDEARNNLDHMLSDLIPTDKYIVVRVNTVDSPYWEKDVELFALNPKVQAFLLPNANKQAISFLEQKLNELNSEKKIIPLIETAIGVEEVKDIITGSERVIALQLGGEDYTADIGVKRTDSGEEILYLRMRLVNIAHAYKLEVIDTPFTSIADLEALREDTKRAKQIGFTGKAVIHPAHVEIVKSTYKPSEQEVEEAQRILEFYQMQEGEKAGVFTVDQMMIDLPIIERAKNTLKKAGLTLN